MSKNAPIIFIDKAVKRSCDSFIKLDKYVNSNKRITKSELKILLENLKKPLFIALEALNPEDEFVDFGDF
jgi:hypothetical protein